LIGSSDFVGIMVVTNRSRDRHTHRPRYVGLAFGGTGLRSYGVTGVDGSWAKHLTAESYTVVMLLTVILIIII